MKYRYSENLRIYYHLSGMTAMCMLDMHKFIIKQWPSKIHSSGHKLHLGEFLVLC